MCSVLIRFVLCNSSEDTYFVNIMYDIPSYTSRIHPSLITMSFKLIDSSNPVQEENVHKFEIPKEFCKPTGTSGM